ncbi:MAG: hypothetical protein J6Z80_03645, partial [Clostridia bacterium]|nr:hypothetical protein [Clostridia bacterium]
MLHRKNRLGTVIALGLFITVTLLCCFVPAAAYSKDDMKDLRTVYVSADGDDKNDGSREAPFKNLIFAFNALSDQKSGGAENSGGVIKILGENICGTYGMNCIPLKNTNTIYLVGEERAVLDFKNSSNYDFIFSGPVVFDNFEMILGAYQSSTVGRQVRVFTQGNRFELGEGFVSETNYNSFYILGSSVSDPENGVFINGGSVGHIWLTHEQKGTDGYLTVSGNGHVYELYSGAAGFESKCDVH